MRAKWLEAMRYPPGEAPWHSIMTPEPDWPAIEAAIRRLDRDEWPWVSLHTNAPIEDEVPENGLCIMGGRGEYRLFLTRGGKIIEYHDAARSHKRIRYWESDQGDDAQERDLCNDFGRVLAIARYFVEQAELDPGATWVER